MDKSNQKKRKRDLLVPVVIGAAFAIALAFITAAIESKQTQLVDNGHQQEDTRQN